MDSTVRNRSERVLNFEAWLYLLVMLDMKESIISKEVIGGK